jgi:hypothetical protein
MDFKFHDAYFPSKDNTNVTKGIIKNNPDI